MPAVNPNNFDYFRGKSPFSILLNSKVQAHSFDYFRGKEPFIIISPAIAIAPPPAPSVISRRRIFIID